MSPYGNWSLLIILIQIQDADTHINGLYICIMHLFDFYKMVAFSEYCHTRMRYRLVSDFVDPKQTWIVGFENISWKKWNVKVPKHFGMLNIFYNFKSIFRSKGLFKPWEMFLKLEFREIFNQVIKCISLWDRQTATPIWHSHRYAYVQNDMSVI